MKHIFKLLAISFVSLFATSCIAQEGTLQSKPTATAPASDDWLLLSGPTYGIRKMTPFYYQPFIYPSTTSQYYRGDKTWQTLNKAAVGLPNVNDTSDANKPISTATQAALDLKANTSALGSAAFSAASAFDAAGAASSAQAASLQKTANLSDIPSPATARSNLGLGTLATQNGTFSGTSSGVNTGDQTTISGNAGSATILQTTRNIYGNAFNGSGDLTQVIASTFGGTGNGFTKFTGPTVSEKTFTLPNTSATLLYMGGALGIPSSGNLANCIGLDINTGTEGNLPVSRLNSGSNADSSTFWCGNGTWKAPGNVYSAGTPTAGQTAEWTNSATIAGISNTGSGLYVKQTGPSLIAPALGTPVSGNLANCTFPVLNQNTTGSAATLTTARNIYGNAFNGSGDLTQVIASSFGGTGNGFTKFIGPTTNEKTFTLPDSSATLLYAGGVLGTPSSGNLANCNGLTLAGGGTGATTAANARTNLGLGTDSVGHQTVISASTSRTSNYAIRQMPVLSSDPASYFDSSQLKFSGTSGKTSGVGAKGVDYSFDLASANFNGSSFVGLSINVPSSNASESVALDVSNGGSAGIGIRTTSEGVAFTASSGSGTAVEASGLATGTGVDATSLAGSAIKGGTFNGTGVYAYTTSSSGTALKVNGKIKLTVASLPTSPAGLSSGDVYLYNDGTRIYLCVVP